MRREEPGARGAQVRNGTPDKQVRHHLCARGGWNQVLAGYEGPVYSGAWEVGTCVHAEGSITIVP